MEQELKRKTTVIGHRNPDTDSICSAICYANLKRAITGDAYIPARAGHVNGETRFVLDYFGMEEPKLVEDVRTQVKDIEIRKTRGVADNISLKKAWNIMQENNGDHTLGQARRDSGRAYHGGRYYKDLYEYL